METKVALEMAYGYLKWIEIGEEQLKKDKIFLDIIGNNMKSALAQGNPDIMNAMIGWLELAEEDVRKVQLGIDIGTNNLRSALDQIKANLPV